MIFGDTLRSEGNSFLCSWGQRLLGANTTIRRESVREHPRDTLVGRHSVSRFHSNLFSVPNCSSSLHRPPKNSVPRWVWDAQCVRSLIVLTGFSLNPNGDLRTSPGKWSQIVSVPHAEMIWLWLNLSGLVNTPTFSADLRMSDVVLDDEKNLDFKCVFAVQTSSGVASFHDE